MLEISVNTALIIIVERPGRNKIDDESFDFHSRVRKAYLEIAKQSSNRVYVVYGEDGPDVVHNKIKTILSDNYSIFSRLLKR